MGSFPSANCHAEQVQRNVDEGQNIADIVRRSARTGTQSLSARFSVLRMTVWRTICTGVYPYHIVRIWHLNLLKPTGHVMHQQFNIQELYVLPTLYLCVLYLSENKQRLVSLTA